MDTEKFQENFESQETGKSREGTSRRKLLMAGAAAVPVMVTIKSTSAQATGWGGGHGGWDKDVFGSVACIQNLEMPWNCEGAVKDVCDKEGLDWSGYWRRKNKHHYGSLEDGGGVMPANYDGGYYNQKHRDNDERIDDIWSYFYDNGRTHFWPGCKFNVSKDRHCTYVQICLSTACWNSIKTAIGQV